MKAILLFDNVNDLLFSKWDEDFLQKMKTFRDEENVDCVDSYTIAQLLSPIITSQRVMASQFGNTYSSMQCKDGTNIGFDEWLDHVIMIVSQDNIDDIHRELMDYKTFVQHICGQNINLLHSPIYKQWLTALVDSRNIGDSVPGASGVIGESGATAVALSSLKNATKYLHSNFQHYHLMLFVGDKLLALYSSKGSEDLKPSDLILFSKQCVAAQEYTEKQKNAEDKFKFPWLSSENSAIVYTSGGVTGSPCLPHSMHIVEVAPRITLAVLLDMDLREVGISVLSSTQILTNLRKLLLQRNLDALPTTLEALENSIKKTTDALRKNKANTSLCARLSSRILELKKSCTTTTPLTPETTATAMHTALDVVLEQLRPPIPSISVHIEEFVKELREKLAPYFDFLRVKAMRFFGLSSGPELEKANSLTQHKYVDDFPGLIHFVYIDRTTGRFLAPDLVDSSDMLTPKDVSGIISRALSLVHAGYVSAAWRRGAFHACSVLWWERSGVPAKPKSLHPAAVRALAPPGDMLGTFYKQLTEMAFPGESNLVCLKELICIHLGLLPVATAVQQARRLAHTVHDIAGDVPFTAADLL